MNDNASDVRNNVEHDQLIKNLDTSATYNIEAYINQSEKFPNACRGHIISEKFLNACGGHIISRDIPHRK